MYIFYSGFWNLFRSMEANRELDCGGISNESGKNQSFHLGCRRVLVIFDSSTVSVRIATKKMLCKIQYHYQFLQSRADVDCCVFVLSLSYLDIRWKNKFWGKSMEILPVGTLNVTLPK